MRKQHSTEFPQKISILWSYKEGETTLYLKGTRFSTYSIMENHRITEDYKINIISNNIISWDKILHTYMILIIQSLFWKWEPGILVRKILLGSITENFFILAFHLNCYILTILVLMWLILRNICEGVEIFILHII